MLAKDALIAWTAPDAADVYASTRGQVRVGPLISDDGYDWAINYACTGGAAYVEQRSYDEMEQVAQVFIDFQTLVVSYGLDPKVVHQAFLNIDEYAERIAPDQPGARARSRG